MKDPAAVSLGQRGGRATWAGLTPAERSESMRRLALAGWKKRRAAKRQAPARKGPR